MHAIVHIGFGKTGTSSINVFLKMNREKLREQRIGFEPYKEFRKHAALPIWAKTQTGAAAHVGATVPYNASTLEDQAALTAHIPEWLSGLAQDRGVDKYIFSGDYFGSLLLTRHEVEALHGLMTSHFDSVEYIVFLRNPFTEIVSQYSQAIKSGSTEDFRTAFVRRAYALSSFDKIELWSQSIGSAPLNVFIFEDGDTVDTICNHCGIDQTGLRPHKQLNTGFNAMGMEVTKVINAHIADNTLSLTDPQRNALFQVVMDQTSTFPALRLPPDLREVLDHRTKDASARVQGIFFEGREHLFPPSDDEGVDPEDPDIIANSQRIAADIIARLDQILDL